MYITKEASNLYESMNKDTKQQLKHSYCLGRASSVLMPVDSAVNKKNKDSAFMEFTLK